MATFKTRARAVDMLGRQQIAGIPTAISELFKNAHDAYADRVEVDYYRSDRLFVLRDDGVGMTEAEFRSRWLTIGTESKLQAKTKLGPPPTDNTKKPRPILGEKGIGRLAIAVIGPQVLVLTQSDRPGPKPDLVAAYVHWSFFEIPGVDLDEIEIPVETFPAHNPPTVEDISRMAATAEQTLERVADRAGRPMVESIQSDLHRLKSIDIVEIEAYLDHLDLHETRGTHFILPGAHDTLEADIDSKRQDDASALEKLLLGFTNTMTPGHPQPSMHTAFRDHKTDSSAEDLVDEARFFTPDEFANADHHIAGSFDEFGQFVGTVTIYGEPHEYLVAWPGARGRKTLCGPFSVHLAVVQPQPKDTTLPPENHQILLSKTRRFGGLYIYRDGIRILPYGDTDYDWLEIEKRRTLKASYYYFSHRNIFGAVLLSGHENASLSEKAGREGFRENTAYRQLRSILETLLINLAGDFFREEGIHVEHFEEHRKELQRQHEALKKRKASVRRKRIEFKEALDIFFQAYDSEEPQRRAFELAAGVERDLAEAQKIADPGQAALRFIQLESGARTALRGLEESYRVVKPRGVGVARSVLREYASYQEAYASLQAGSFAQIRGLVEGIVSEAAERARIEIDRRVRIERALSELVGQTRRAARAERSETFTSLDEVRGEVREATREAILKVENTVEETLAEFASTDVSELDDLAAASLRDRLEENILRVREEGGEFLRYVRAQLEAIDVSGEISQLDQIEALEQRNMDLEARADYDIELAQLGQAVGIINHEFDASVRAIRNHLRDLKAWADINEGIDEVYAGLRTNFDHLDGFLTLFTPFQRRLNRKKIKISGADIARYVRELFGPRFERHSVDFNVTLQFVRWTVVEFPSSFYPVFVNLVDNAIFWLSESKPPRIISIDSAGSAVLVSNNGPPIPSRRWQLVFEQGTSFKPGGRGLGLFIAREALRTVGFTLDLVDPQEGMGVTFRIAPRDTK